MKFAALLLALYAPVLASASPDPDLVKQTLEGSGSCSNFVRFDDANVYLGFGPYRRAFEEPREPIPGRVDVLPLGHPEGRFSLSTLDSAIDATREGDSLFVLTYSAIEEWSLSSKSRIAAHPTYAIQGPLAYKEHAQAFARSGDKLVIAHGRLGVSFFSLKTRRLTNQFRLAQGQLPLESMATGVAVNGGTAYLVLDSFHLVQNGKPPFRGVILVDTGTEKVVGELDGMDPGADAVVADSEKALVSFGGNPVWKYSLAKLGGRTLPEPDRRIWRFPLPGNPIGRAALDSRYYYSCYAVAPEKPGKPWKRIPLALDRASFE